MEEEARRARAEFEMAVKQEAEVFRRNFGDQQEVVPGNSSEACREGLVLRCVLIDRLRVRLLDPAQRPKAWSLVQRVLEGKYRARRVLQGDPWDSPVPLPGERLEVLNRLRREIKELEMLMRTIPRGSPQVTLRHLSLIHI